MFNRLCLKRCFGKKGQPVSSLFHIPFGFANSSGHAGGLRGFSTYVCSNTEDTIVKQMRVFNEQEHQSKTWLQKMMIRNDNDDSRNKNDDSLIHWG